MILYVTDQTYKRLGLKSPDEMKSKPMAMLSQAVIDRERDDSFMHWGGMLFFFDKRCCIQVVHFESKLTLFLLDIDPVAYDGLGQLIAFYLFEQYKGNAEMTRLLKQLFEDSRVVVCEHLKDRSIIDTLNHTQRSFLQDGERLYKYVENGVLNSRKLNTDVNRDRRFARMVDGSKEYYASEVLYQELLKERYRGKRIKKSGRVDLANFAGIEVKKRY